MSVNDIEFVDELVVLCRKHGAVIFPRTDGKSAFISVMIGEVWLDFKRIDSKEDLPR